MLGAATVVTALIAEILVGALDTFAKTRASDFFVAAVIVAIVGNAAEHGGAVVVAHRGNISWPPRSRSRRLRRWRVPDPGGRAARVADRAALAVLPPVRARRDRGAVIVTSRCSRRASRPWRGAVLIGGYAVAAAAFAVGDR